MGHNSTTKAVRLHKEEHPELYCIHRECLHRAPCPKHPRVSSTADGGSSLDTPAPTYHLRFHDPWDGRPDEGKKQYSTIEAATKAAEHNAMEYGFDGVIYVIDSTGKKVTENVNPF